MSDTSRCELEPSFWMPTVLPQVADGLDRVVREQLVAADVDTGDSP
jgi:hypothetical protein